MSSLDEYNERRRLEGKKPITVKKQRPPLTLRRDIQQQPCRVCGRRPVEYHHIVPRSAFSKHARDVHDPANAMPLCHLCHQHHHTRGSNARVPRHLLTPAELAFILTHQSEHWLDLWYPERPIP